MPTPSRAVFLSYASEDAPAAQRIADALRAAGIDVWFDQSELRGGEAWDRQIRKQIHDCALFVPVISAHSDARHEGYFRREWRLAVERAGDMSERVAFLVPVVIDDTRESGADVPDRFREVQWTRLPEGAASAPFIERVRRLLLPEAAQATSGTPTLGTVPQVTPIAAHRKRLRSRAWVLPAAVLIAVAVAYFAFERLAPKRAVPSAVAPVGASSAAADGFNPPPHSIAVLPFLNMSGDKEQEYFSEGLTEELLDSLSRINELQVAARTSSFSFQGQHPDIATVARKLNVAAVLEGSVRRSARTVRITAQLVNGTTGYHLWSQTYDRGLGDVLQLQTEIATAVAGALKVTLLGNVSAKIELGGTRNPAAFDAYLRAMRAYNSYHDDKDLRAAIVGLDESIKLDPSYALAYAARSLVRSQLIDEFEAGPTSAGVDAVRGDALKAIALAPGLAEGHLALAVSLSTFRQDMTEASSEYERAATLAPGNALILRRYALSAAELGRVDVAIAAAQRAVTLDPLTAMTRRWLARVLLLSRHYNEAIAAADETNSLDADDGWAAAIRGESYYLLGDLQSARSACEIPLEHYWLQVCRAIVYQRIGQRPAAEAALATMQGDNFAYQYMQIFAQWGNTAKALEWLDTAMRLHDTGLPHLKSDPLLDPLRNEPRFQAIERELKFPN